jgi:CelD/BcsL family acetyltransferase involved in cellulose biosynthesis
MTPRARLLSALAEHPAGLAAENLLAKVCRPGERQSMFKALRRLEEAGVVSISRERQDRKRRDDIAGLLVQTTTEAREASIRQDGCKSASGLSV